MDAYSFEDTIARGDEVYERMRAQALGEIPLDKSIFERAPGEHEQLLEIIDALEKDERRCFTANLPNGGAIPNLPAEAILELSCVATGRGLLPAAVPDFADRLAAPLTDKIAAHALTVEAALKGDRGLFVEALLLDGAVSDRETAEKLADELLQAHRQYLPQFA
jgi:alpha-galactosidase